MPPELNYCNFDDDAGYVYTMLSHMMYLISGAEVSPWASVRGWCLEANWVDWMHCSHLGTERDTSGSALIDLLERNLLPLGDVDLTRLAGVDRADLILKQAWVEMRTYTKSHNMNVPTGLAFSLTSLGRGRSAQDFPDLSHTYKAMSVRSISIWIADLCYRLGTDSRTCKLRSLCTWAIAELHFIFNMADLVLTPDQVARAQHAGMTYLRCYLALAGEAMAAGLKLWKLRPKHHGVWHIIVRLRHLPLNPARISCMRSEDALGRFKKVCRRCHAKTASSRLLSRWIMCLCDEWGVRHAKPA